MKKLIPKKGMQKPIQHPKTPPTPLK